MYHRENCDVHAVSLRSRSLAVVLVGFVFVLATMFFSSCTVSPEALQLFLNQALLQGMITPEQARLIREAARSFQTESRPFTYEEEYAIGRVVAAAVLSQYPVYNQPELTAYVNKIGQGLSFFSARPLLPHGYHILILDSDEAHAFATPGGFVLVTRGLLSLAASEDMLAALLAHEISHTALGHGLVSLASYRMGDLAMYYAALSTQAANTENKETAALFSAAVHDFVSLISVQGYSQAMEFEADAEAMHILYEAGYRTSALQEFVNALADTQNEHIQQYSMQHPLPADRLARIAVLEQQYEQAAQLKARRAAARKTAASFKLEKQFSDIGYPASEGSVLETGIDTFSPRSQAFGTVAPLELIRRERFEAMKRLF
jgi:predicted Zn-dependent protease